MQERITLAHKLFHVGLLIVLGSAIVSAMGFVPVGSGMFLAGLLGGGVLSVGARTWLATLQRTVRDRDSRFGTWVVR